MKKIIKKILDLSKLPFNFFKYLKVLKSVEFKANFKYEGDIIIKVPKVSFFDFFSKNGRNDIFQSHTFLTRPKKEVLLRRIIYDLYQTKYLDKDKSIIDIGCSIGDNALVWSKMLNKGNVYAIEPLLVAIKFAKKASQINCIKNIFFINEVCSNQSGIFLDINENHMGTFFSNSKNENNPAFISKTIDEVIPLNDHNNIGLLHIDVEGFEENVLFGSKKIIEKSRPVILFEQHISDEDPKIIINFLDEYDYETFMINEVLPGNDYDCRNFVAFDKRKDTPEFNDFKNFEGRKNDIWYATLGSSLVKVYS